MGASATNNELFAVLGVGALIAAIIVYVQTPKVDAKPQVVVVQQHPPPVNIKPAHWGMGGVGPGWGGGRWLGEGDFKHFGSMDHPFSHQPRYSGHPMHMPALPNAPPGPRAGEGMMPMMPPMGASMGPTRY